MSEKFSYDDFMLRRAMKQIMDDEVTALPSDIELAESVDVSDEFREKMSALTKQSRRRLTFLTTMKAVAAIFIGAVLIFSVEQMMENGLLTGGDMTELETGGGSDDASIDQTEGAAPTTDGAKTEAAIEEEEPEKDEGKTGGAGGSADNQYISYTDYANAIDDIMVERINEAGNHGSQAEFRLNEDIYYLAWKAEYYRLTEHLGEKRMKEDPRPKLEDNEERSKNNLIQGEKYREQCIRLLKSMDDNDDYKVQFSEKDYEELKGALKSQ